MAASDTGNWRRSARLVPSRPRPKERQAPQKEGCGTRNFHPGRVLDSLNTTMHESLGVCRFSQLENGAESGLGEYSFAFAKVNKTRKWESVPSRGTRVITLVLPLYTTWTTFSSSLSSSSVVSARHSPLPSSLYGVSLSHSGELCVHRLRRRYLPAARESSVLDPHLRSFH